MKAGLVFALLAVASSGVARASSGIDIDPVHLVVQDAQTGEPVADAVVAVSYPVYVEAGRNLHEGPWYEQSGDLHVAETVTAANGDARFEAMTVNAPADGRYVRHDVPLLLIYKEGYQPLWLTEKPRNDNYKGVMPPPARIESSFDGEVIALERESADGLSEININQATGFMAGDIRTVESCRWTQFPQLLARLRAAAQSRPELGQRLRALAGDSRCTQATPLAWAGHPGARELRIDANALQASHALVSPPAPEAGAVTIVVTGEGARGILFFERSGSAQRHDLRFNGGMETLGPVLIDAGERITVRYLDIAGDRIRKGHIGLGQ